MTTLLIKNATLIDGTGGDAQEGVAIVVRGERIEQIARTDQVTAFADDATVIDAKGKYVLPGLIDTHVHMMMEISNLAKRLNDPFSLRFYQASAYMRRTIDAGITSVRDAGGADLGVKTAVEQGLTVGPRMQISITPLTITGGHGDSWTLSGIDLNLGSYPGNPDGICDGVEAVRKKVREVLRAGADIIKVHATGGVLSPTDHPEFTQFSLAELSVMVEEAKFRKGVKVMAHAQGAEGVKNAIRAGIHSIEHGIFLDDEAIELMLEHGTYLVPTLLAPVAVLEAAESSDAMPEYGVRKCREVVEFHKESIAKAYEAGVRIAMGTDAGVMAHGTNLRELGLMCEIGMSPMEAIVATTKTAAACLGWGDELGTVEPGKLADIVIANTNPLRDIRSLESQDNILTVIQGGEILKDIR
ncbi:metal-dependent hydrolase family protein [Alicyclobacillus fastidiosus]|uniref:Amidohydrolase family protein n=1 Tax=Alicyclobacillus fastidiosus TaxID=392011 RepID=A0ABV5ABD8_9BACL|nr:amidohydrolase family protein [Alicyclobacillus fastidiosus]WEH10515.1 amidohydrolase family protein [Alicyclobacillus fastidiosus]